MQNFVHYVYLQYSFTQADRQIGLVNFSARTVPCSNHSHSSSDDSSLVSIRQTCGVKTGFVFLIYNKF
jgi:hypothetical protein